MGLPWVVCEYKDVFPKELSRLPPHRDLNFYIELHPDISPISMMPHRLVLAELQELKVQLQEFLDRSFMRLSTSHWDTRILFAKKKDKNLRLCIDYQQLKKVTI